MTLLISKVSVVFYPTILFEEDALEDKYTGVILGRSKTPLEDKCPWTYIYASIFPEALVLRALNSSMLKVLDKE